MWVRGLKLLLKKVKSNVTVAPYVGAWIETRHHDLPLPVFPSHPMWVRGLKPLLPCWLSSWRRRTLCGCVDWNLKDTLTIKVYFVAPYVGAWIETFVKMTDVVPYHESHPMWVRGLKLKILLTTIKPFQSHPMWVRGLKLFHRLYLSLRW